MSILPSDSLRRSAVLIALLALSAVYFVYTYMYVAREEQADEIRLRLADLGAQSHTVRPEDSLDQPELVRRIEVYEAHLARLEELIPSNEEVASLLEAISVQEALTGVEVTMLRPELPEAGELYDRWSYELAVKGDYHAIGSFLTAVASLERIMAPADLVLDSGSPSNSNAEQPGALSTIVARFRIRTYVVPPARTAQASPPKPSSVTPR